MSELKLDAEPRTLTGRKVRQLRTQGLVPVVVYGNNQEPINLQVTARNLETTLHHGGFSQLVRVNVQGGGTHNVLVREIQRHPTSHAYLHVDLYAVNMSEKQHTSVPVVGTGKPTALVTGFMVLQEKDMIEVEALPADIPANIEVDITELDLERPITVADLPKIPGVEYLDEPTEHLFALLPPRVEEEEEPEPEEELAEPEVVARGKQDEEEEEE
jgi:large subunit ribosomal protein L25